jgi:hypothetical protein
MDSTGESMKDKEAHDKIETIFRTINLAQAKVNDLIQQAPGYRKQWDDKLQTLEATILNLTLRLRKLEDATGHVPRCETCHKELDRP